MKKIVLLLFVIIVVVVGTIFGVKSFNRKNNESNNEFDVEKRHVEIIGNSEPDDEIPEEIKYVDMNNEEKVNCCTVIGCFDDGQKLKTEDYLKVVAYAINTGMVPNKKISYTENEINNIVYSIFQVKLSENKSAGDFVYDNGIYRIKKTSVSKAVLKDVQSDVAAGSVYITYEHNGSKYIARLTTNGVTGKNHVSSVIKND